MSQPSRQRYVAIVIVGALHVLIFEVWVHTPRSQRAAEEDTVWSTLFFVPAAGVPRRSPIRPQHEFAPVPPRVQPSEVEVARPITMAPDSTAAQPSIDWMAALQGAATDVASQRGPGDSVRGTPSPSGSSASTHHHAYGEQYKLETGETVIWVSDHCFVVSEPPMLGTPNALAHEAVTHTQCVRNADPRSDLFKDLPAYRKHNEAP